MILMRANSDDAYSLTHLKSQLEREWAARCREAGRLRSAKTDPLLELSVGEWASSSLYATRLSFVPLDRCFIADSLLPGAGRGVFAKTAMAAGSLATLYPGDAVHIETSLAAMCSFSERKMELFYPEEAAHTAHVWCSAASDGSLIVAPTSLIERGRDYEIEVDSNFWPTSLLADPTRIDNAAYLGHMLNDGATCGSEEHAHAYLAESHARRNTRQVCVMGCHAAIITTRNVERGEELLLSYGTSYWTHRARASRTNSDSSQEHSHT